MKQASPLCTVEAFGWKLVKMALPQGHSYGLIVGADRDRSSVGTVTLFTKGRITGVNTSTGEALDERVPGVLSTSLGPLKAGKRVLTAEEDSEWWCLDSRVNSAALPGIALVHATAGQRVPGLCFVATGISEGFWGPDHTAQDDCMVLVFDRERA